MGITFSHPTDIGGGFLMASQRMRFRVVELEGRCLPSNYRLRVTPGAIPLTDNWTDSLNWQIEVPVVGYVACVPGDYPGKDGSDDDVSMDGTSNKKRIIANVENLKLHSLTIYHYTGNIVLQNALTLSGERIQDGRDLPDSTFNLDAPAKITGFTDVAGQLHRGTLILEAGTKGTWKNGAFYDVTVDMRGQPATTTLLVEAGGSESSRTMVGATFDISGQLLWDGGSVATVGGPDELSQINIKSGGKFNIRAAAQWGGDDPTRLTIQNAGTVQVSLDDGATPIIIGNYTTTGYTILGTKPTATAAGKMGNLHIHTSTGKVTQTAGEFQLWSGSKFTVAGPAGPTLYIRHGLLIGSGTIAGNLFLGDDQNQPDPAPIVSPGGAYGLGTITVVGNLRLYRGKFDIEINGPGAPGAGGFDQIVVTGIADLRGSNYRAVDTVLLEGHFFIRAGTKLPFLIYDSLVDDFAQKGISPKWIYDPPGAKKSEVEPTEDIRENLPPVRGMAWLDNGAQPGVRVAGEGGIEGVGVRLLDDSGNEVASTTTDADGNFHFDNVPPGVWFVEFARPFGLRLAAANVGDPATDSDPDPANGRARIVVGAVAEVTNIDAGFYSDAAAIAVDDAYRGHKNVAFTGNVLANDTDADADALTAAVAAGPAHGTLVLNPDGSFTYTPDADYVGPDSFTYSVADGYDGTATGTADITVVNTPAPVGAPDGYSTAAGPLEVDAASGLLANDTNQNNGTLVAVLATDPAHGTLALNADGSFTYTPDEDFVGTDSFAYRPTDADGPGVLTTVSISVTDHPPVAVSDSATTSEDTSVTLAVLANDTDADADALAVLGASDGLFGTTVVNANGTITYTPGANFNGTDTFVYVIDDGHGRLAYSVATVTVAPVNDAPTIDTSPVVVQKDTALDIDLRTLVSDPETGGDALTFAVSNAQHGTVELLADGYTARFTPAAGYYGAASFTLAVTDTGDGTSPAITTTGTISTPVNAPPTAGDVSTSYHVVAGQPLVVYPMCSDPDGDELTRTVVEQPAHGTVAWDEAYGGWVYTNTDPTYTGTETFRYAVSDGRGGSATGTVTITLTNQPPTGDATVSLSVQNQGPIWISPDVWDPDSDELTVTSVTQPSVGSVSPDPSGPGVTYFPPAGFTGTVTFSYTVSDGHGGTLVVNVTITITA